ncbi:At-hook motif nuclear-localized protein [Thalictrum thalictroides]|uniref:AT-hook motif nuclear-localized protein n=1 Tax=Thalictrum thalictroides TaxID=46969 RepID=A0A7J6W6W5_THATH|nr:At-hook motif nuclear-localized protein [Thalictrum thalictroides]
MDGREGMGITGPGTYYMHRGVPGSGSGAQTGLHGPSGFRPLSNPTIPVQSNMGGGSVGSTYPVESSSALHGVNASMAPGMPSGEPVKRKRGRPRKYGPDGAVSLALSPLSSTPTPSSLTPTQKRGRGRPPGTGRKQQLASLGELVSGSAGMGFTPHVITIAIGEDIATKVMSFSQQGPRAVCILSANGAVSTVTLRQPSSSGGTVTYEGRFEILCLSGSFMLTDNGGSHNRTGGLTISLSSPDGRVIGGGVGGMLIAATPVQVVVGSFLHGGSKTKNKGAKTEFGPDSDNLIDNTSAAPTSLPPSQTYTTTSAGSAWPASRPIDMRNAVQLDIDLTRG